jgi:prepilin-type N-terminal cleavage/methylation domain-containing protein
MTLIECLVAMALLGLVALLAAGGLSFGARAWEVVESSGAAADDARVAEALLRETVTAAYPAFTMDAAGRTA